MSVSDDRWTCPNCHRTVVVAGTQPDVRCALDACRKRHDRAHAAAARLDAALPGPRRPTVRPLGDEVTPAGSSRPAERGRVSSERNEERP